MKLILTISAMILFLITGCESGKQPANDFLTVDITANYPKKELILQDFLDVEYIPLETNEEFITSASMQAIGKNLIILRNKNGQDGDIFIFDRTGKGQRKINRSGQGSQEYTNIGSIALDEEKGELFINNYYSSQFIVYDLSGNFKRTLKYDKDFNFNSGKIYNFDQDNLICYDEIGNYKNLRKSAFWLLSKQEDAIFECVVYNNDFVDQTPVDMWYEHGILKIINNDGIAFIKKLEANELVEAYGKGKLKGRLNEIAAGLNEESNPVIMVAKYKE